MNKYSPEDILEIVVKAADDRRGQDILALNMQGISILSDYQVIVTASSSRQTMAIAQEVLQSAAEQGIEASIEGKADGHWLLVDLGMVVVHIFDEENRERYNLEGLWTEAPYAEIDQWLTD